MNAVFVIGAIKSGGAERVMVNLSNHLTDVFGDNVTLVSIHSCDTAYPISEKVNFVNGLGTSSEIKAIRKLREVIKSKKPDIVLSFMTHINIATLIAAAGTGTPVIVSERNDPVHVPTDSVRRILRKLIYPMAKGYVFQTEDAKAFFSKRIQRKSKVIINPVHVERSPVPFADRKREIVTVGRLMKQKNQKIILEAFADFLLNHREYTLHIYGDGPLESELKEQAEELHLCKNITFHGSVKDLHDQICESEVFVLTSDYEGMPNALMEAMALGLVCISTDCPCGGPRALITDGEDGVLIPVGDVPALERTLNAVIENREKMSCISEQSVKRMEELNPIIVFNEWRMALMEWSKSDV